MCKGTRNIILTLFFCCCSLLGFAQQKFTVEVFSNDNGHPLAYAFVNVYSDSAKTLLTTLITNEEGKVELFNMACPCLIEVAAIGYEPQQLKVTMIEQASYSVSLTKKFSTLNEVVITGVQKPVKTQNALSIYRLITREMMLSQGAVTLNDAVTTQLNMNVNNDNVLGAGIRMQGLGGDKVKILIDGMPVNGREGGNIDMGQLNLYNIDHIEIVQGPMSVIYGSDALGGVINLVTKTQFKKKELSAVAHYESVGKYNFNLSGGYNIAKRHFINIGGGRNYFDGWKYTDTVSPHRQQLFKPKEQYLGNFDYSYNAPSGFKARLSSDYLTEKVTNKGVATVNAYEGYAIDEYYRTERSLNRLMLSGKLGKTGHWQSQNGYAYYKHTKNVYQKDLVSLKNELSKDENIQDTSKYTELTLRGTYNNTWKLLDYTAGYDIDLQRGNSERITGNSKKIEDYAAFGLLSAKLLQDKLTLQGGLRMSSNSIYKVPPIGSFNILVKPGAKWQVRASYAQGYRAPSLKEMYLEFIDQNHHILGNTQLKPEHGDHFQASASYEIWQYQANYVQAIVTGYYNDIRDEIVLINQFPDIPSNIDYKYGNLERERNAIANLQIEGQYHNLHFLTGYAYNQTFAQENLYSSFNYSEANANLQYYFKKARFNLNLFYKYTGKQPFLQTGIDGAALYSGTQEGYHTMDASLEKKFWKRHIQLICGVKNIFDVQRVQTSGVVVSGAHTGNGGPSLLPRNLFTTLRLNF